MESAADQTITSAKDILDLIQTYAKELEHDAWMPKELSTTIDDSIQKAHAESPVNADRFDWSLVEENIAEAARLADACAKAYSALQALEVEALTSCVDLLLARSVIRHEGNIERQLYAAAVAQAGSEPDKQAKDPVTGKYQAREMAISLREKQHRLNGGSLNYDHRINTARRLLAALTRQTLERMCALRKACMYRMALRCIRYQLG